MMRILRILKCKNPNSRLQDSWLYWGQLDLSAETYLWGQGPLHREEPGNFILQVLGVSFYPIGRIRNPPFISASTFPPGSEQSHSLAPWDADPGRRDWEPALYLVGLVQSHLGGRWQGWAGKLRLRLSLSSGELWAGVGLGTVPTQSERLEPFQPHRPVGDVDASPPFLDKCPRYPVWDVIAPYTGVTFHPSVPSNQKQFLQTVFKWEYPAARPQQGNF